MEPNNRVTNNRALTILFGIYLAAHILFTSLQIYHAYYKSPFEHSKCSCQK